MRYILDNYQIVFSDHSFEELVEVLTRAKFQKYFDRNQLDEFIEIIRSNGLFIRTNKKFEVCRDPDDNKFLELSFEAKAKYIISGDQDLLIMKAFEGTRIVDLEQAFCIIYT